MKSMYLVFNPGKEPMLYETALGKDLGKETDGNTVVYNKWLRVWYGVNASTKQWYQLIEDNVPAEYKMQLLLIDGDRNE